MIDFHLQQHRVYDTVFSVQVQALVCFPSSRRAFFSKNTEPDQSVLYFGRDPGMVYVTVNMQHGSRVSDAV